MGGSRSTGGSKASGGAKSTGGAAAGGASSTGTGDAPTWTELYNAYFAAGTAGDCVSCHANNRSASFNNATTMCSTLKQLGFIGTGTAKLDTLLTWFNKGGSMPENRNPTPANAVADITAWQNAGAVCP